MMNIRPPSANVKLSYSPHAQPSRLPALGLEPIQSAIGWHPLHNPVLDAHTGCVTAVVVVVAAVTAAVAAAAAFADLKALGKPE